MNINKNSKGQTIEDVVQSYEFNFVGEFYQYIEDSYINGNKKQVVSLFKEMPKKYQIIFLENWMNMEVLRVIAVALYS